jgi:hypothetical protein
LPALLYRPWWPARRRPSARTPDKHALRVPADYRHVRFGNAQFAKPKAQGPSQVLAVHSEADGPAAHLGLAQDHLRDAALALALSPHGDPPVQIHGRRCVFQLSTRQPGQGLGQEQGILLRQLPGRDRAHQRRKDLVGLPEASLGIRGEEQRPGSDAETNARLGLARRHRRILRDLPRQNAPSAGTNRSSFQGKEKPPWIKSCRPSVATMSWELPRS